MGVQGHEEFDEEITLAGSGQATPFEEAPPDLAQQPSPEGTAPAPQDTQHDMYPAQQDAASEGHNR